MPFWVGIKGSITWWKSILLISAPPHPVENRCSTLHTLQFMGVCLQMGLRYGCPVEDVLTGLSIQCLGWKSVYYNPARKGFLGVAATSLDQTLLQHKRWSEGDLQVLLSRYSPAWYGLGRISPGLLLGYCSYCLWAPNSLATVFYSTAPSLYLVRGISLFPQVCSLFSLLHDCNLYSSRLSSVTSECQEFLCFSLLTIA